MWPSFAMHDQPEGDLELHNNLFLCAHGADAEVLPKLRNFQL